MSIWIILSWVFVLILTAINVVVFLKLKQASEQMMGALFPGKNMNEALSQMQGMMQGMQGMSRGGAGRGGNPFAQGGRGPNTDAQLKAAMEMLRRSQQKR